ncbi:MULTISPECIES: divalent-cation tolerance protein CutA [Pseudoalteromonas]|jgi:periplasmic divalent cation tolerance protein|uniref:Divalent-cation tolerance protein CutA n=1 Tax=Pseudoalteromonas carrageenovora IAM 12662 TaxID=1314868 RepID=A0A2K4XD20_PSEVC|nr:MULTISPECIES: divalent-cation tolerance protein CutA [Pseudoalteromonas]KTF11077.1 cation tolerance protein CutA [Pseudoalteromonas sp. H103]MBE0381090.1 periplasmic divalent cation tolerance protein [Pseudoalteromonas carrageenovora IAM 12662]MCQ8891079.1 divalent-cation tolerance protein CutA [Pseudoalteromonas carrageenovora]MDO6464994.1 divalent-cation tolerance protein CutA [Pseudoalteromonas carrageenovora]MDO6548251.1 divalent-cation tolerance protein CutA [Pseudoalteromonas carragee|tara:strand:- start:1116 stop:1436 length:321 start_codon:yes stop_codon:yes gene_type:complete
MNTQFKLIFTTCKDEPEARALARALVEKKLAACVNVLPNIGSIYMWEGEIAEATETKLLIKTKLDKMNDVFLTIKELHSYEVPEIQVVEVSTGNLAYFNWMDEVLN